MHKAKQINLNIFYATNNSMSNVYGPR